MKMKKTDLENFIASELEEKPFEDILEDFDLDPVAVFVLLYQNVMINEDTLESKFSDY
jgi:hypothetical protein